ncbi:MAG: ABC transporter ATP-binding protein/permease [Clostridia bacterium]|nr:ABC transporter ATP-binding protein/permease [Clostridia bacterium]
MPKKKEGKGTPSIGLMFGRYLAVNRRHVSVMVFSATVTIVASLFVGLRAFYYGKLVDDAHLGLIRDFTAVLPLLLAQLAYIPLEIGQGLLTATFSNRSIMGMRLLTFQRIAHAQMQTIETHKTGDLISRVNRDIEGFANEMDGFVTWDLPQMVAFGVALSISFVISWQLTLICYTAIPVLGFAMSKTATPMSKYALERNTADGEAMALANNLIGGFALAKSYDLREAMQERFESSIDRAVRAGIKCSIVDFSLRPMQMMMIFLPYALITGVGAYFAAKGMMNVGGVLTFLLLSDYVLNPIQSLPWTIRGLFTAAGHGQRIFEVWDMPQEEEGTGGAKAGLTLETPVVFRDVSFAYHEAAPVLKDMSLSLRPGEKVALVGASGCGKSTALKLLLAFYRHQSGNIYAMGGDSRDYSLTELRKLFSYVGQDAYLFPGTIWQNVKMGREDATDEQIMKAIRAARVDDLDLHAEIGERGNRLSGGQRQRVCIARAMIKDAPILLLDEPTSALDTESEYLVSLALDELIREKTTLLVAHRLSAMRGIDRILCIEDGKIAEEGTHEELMQKGGLYFRLYQAQIKEEGST